MRNYYYNPTVVHVWQLPIEKVSMQFNFIIWIKANYALLFWHYLNINRPKKKLIECGYVQTNISDIIIITYDISLLK